MHLLQDDDCNHKRPKKELPVQSTDLAEKNYRIISNDLDVVISRYANACYIYNFLLGQKNYRSKKHFVYEMYGNVLYRCIKNEHRNRILYEKFTIKKLTCNFTSTFDSYESFKLSVCADTGNAMVDEYDIEECYRQHLNKNNHLYKLFKQNFYKNKYDVSTPTYKVENIEFFTYEFYYFLLQDIEFDYGLNNLEDTVKRFYFLLLDLYDDCKIYYKMDYEDVESLVNNTDLYVKLQKTKYKPYDIYCYFSKRLEERLSDVDINSPSAMDIDKAAMLRYKQVLESRKEEGEL